MPLLQPELDSLVQLIPRQNRQTAEDSQLEKAKHALRVAGRARRLLNAGDAGSAWLRLNEALEILRGAGVEAASVQAIQTRLDQILFGGHGRLRCYRVACSGAGKASRRRRSLQPTAA